MEKSYVRARPSALPNLALCPQWKPRTADGRRKDAIDEAADEGTMLHRVMENLARVPVAEWPKWVTTSAGLEPAHIDLINEAAGQVADLFSLGLPVATKTGLGLRDGEVYALDDVLFVDRNPTLYRNLALGIVSGVYAEVNVRPSVCLPGTADLVVVFGEKAFVVDYKIVRVERDHDLQLKAYVVGVFEATDVNEVEGRIVAPRLGRDTHAATTYRREDLPALRREIEEVIAAAEDGFMPGCPGEACCFCRGNGRCAYQAASLRDIPVDDFALAAPAAWKPILAAATPELRAERRRLVKWLEGFVDAVKEDDRSWRAANPDAKLPGFSLSVSPGRVSLDKTRLGEVNQALMQRFGFTADRMLSFCVPDKAAITSFLSLAAAMPEEEAKKAYALAIAEFSRRGDDIISFRPEKRKKALQS